MPESPVLAVFAIIAGLLVLSLAVPIDVAFRVEGIEAFKARVAIRWLFGLVRFGISAPDSIRRQRKASRAKPRAARVRANREERGPRADILTVLRQSAFRRRLYRLARDLVRAARPTELGLRLRLGLGDPADTGRLWAFVGPLNAAAQDLRNAEVLIEPDFGDPACEFEAHGRFVLVPLQFLALVIAFALSPPAVRAWRTLRAGRA